MRAWSDGTAADQRPPLAPAPPRHPRPRRPPLPLLRATRLQPDAADTLDAADLLGRYLADRVERDRAIGELVRDHAAERLDDIVGHLGRSAVRRLDAMAPLASTDTWDRASDAAVMADDARISGVLLPAYA